MSTAVEASSCSPHSPSSINPFWCPNTDCTSAADFIGGSSVSFALVPIIPPSNSCSSSNANGWSGTLSPTVGIPPLTFVGTSSSAGITIIKAPGQNSSANLLAIGGIDLANFQTYSTLGIRTGIGDNGDLPFMSQTFWTAS